MQVAATQEELSLVTEEEIGLAIIELAKEKQLNNLK